MSAPAVAGWNPGGFDGVPVVVTDMAPDGTLYLTTSVGRPMLLVGSGPITMLPRAEWCHREALRIVHEGMADVLAWLGEAPYVPPTAAGILAGLRGPGGAS